MASPIISRNSATPLSAYRSVGTYEKSAQSGMATMPVGQFDDYQFIPHPLLGGITLDYARQLAREFSAEPLSRKSMFNIQVDSESSYKGDAQAIPKKFFMYATAVSYNPITITSDRKNIGGARIDGVTGNDPVTIRITTMDDRSGTLKKWFDALSQKVVNDDGTVGLPADYCVRISISHGYAFKNVLGAESAFKNAYLMRPESVDYDLDRTSRSELQLIQFVFSQFDTFMPVIRGS